MAVPATSALREEERRRGFEYASELKRRADADHRNAASVDGIDDLRVVDALQVDRRDAQIAVPELALDDDERHAVGAISTAWA